MNLLTYGLTVSLGVLASSVAAEVVVIVDGEELTLSGLMETCQSMTGNPAAKLSCFETLSQLLEEQESTIKPEGPTIAEALAELQTVANHQDTETGLTISGTGCNVDILYFNNFFHISRRNVSELDLFSAKFDTSQLSYDQVNATQGGFFQATLADGASAQTAGGLALYSADLNFAPKAGQMPVGTYAQEVVAQLQTTDGQSFQFPLVHPAKSQSSADILGAFETFVTACNAQ